MHYYLSKTHDPYFNLATEEYFLSSLQSDIIYFYRNNPSVIIGRNQNIYAEINEEYIEANHIPVVRRLSGGGAVFHDLGNLNFCFITRSSAGNRSKSFEEFTQPIQKALLALGVPVQFSGRNDLTVEGKKISGNAQYHSGDKILHHGTLLFSSNINDLSAALKVKPGKIKAHHVDSYRSRVTNISSHLQHAMSIEDFINYITQELVNDSEASPYDLHHEAQKQIQSLVDQKYTTYDYIYGKFPNFSYEHSIKYAGGTIDVRMNLFEGLIKDLHFYGDFFGRRDVGELVTMLLNAPHKKKHFSDLLTKVDLDAYFMGITPEEFLLLFF